MQVRAWGITRIAHQTDLLTGGHLLSLLHREGLQVSIDGDEEYLKYDDFGLDELKCEVTIEGAMRGQRIRLASRSEFTLLKCMEM